jgi:Na+/H+ antiporter NhaC
MLKNTPTIFSRLLFCLAIICVAFTANAQGYEVEFDAVQIQETEKELIIKASKYSELPDTVYMNGEAKVLFWDGNNTRLSYTVQEGVQELSIADQTYSSSGKGIPLGWSVIPPLVAIALALIFKEVLSSLFAGIFSGAAIIGAYSDGIAGVFKGLYRALDSYILKALADEGHLSVIIFSMIIGGVVHIITKNGGMTAVVNRLAKKATTPKSGQMVSYFLGFTIFFDDYANTLVVGNTMRPITDRLKISREKLAYIVDSTAAPIAAIAFVTTWIGAELGYISQALNIPVVMENIGELSAYSVFFSSIPYSFYPILTLIFMYMLIKRGVDFGPMLKFEREARKKDKITGTEEGEDDQTPASKAYLALVPIATIVFGTIIGLLITGYSSETWSGNDSFWLKLSETMGNADSYQALLWSSLTALFVTIALTVATKQMTFTKTMEMGVDGFKTMLTAVLILSLAWALAIVTEDLHTADYLTALVKGKLNPAFFPTITFILGALVAFSTGSSWGTMAILYPLVLPALVSLGADATLESAYILSLFFNTTAAVLAGSVLGDHCSPISDTTILSSLATKCNHINHVKSQMPYALTVGAVALITGIIPTGFGISPWLCFPVSIISLFLVVKYFGKKVEG